MTTMAYRPTDWWAAMQVSVPEGSCDGVHIRRFEVDRDQSGLSFITGRGRGTPPGTYTGLYRGGSLWMSDTPDERNDHMPALRAAERMGAERVLVNGLGLGMVVAALLTVDSVRHVDVVELDPAVISLVAPHYIAAADASGKTVTVHQADAYTIKWAAGMTWDVAWHDVWRDLCTDNLPQMATLHRRYGRRVRWQGSWGRDLLERVRVHENRRPGWR